MSPYKALAELRQRKKFTEKLHFYVGLASGLTFASVLVPFFF